MPIASKRACSRRWHARWLGWRRAGRRGWGAVEDNVASRLYAESEGNPLFLGERIRDLLESGQGSLNPAPLSIQEIIAGRLRRLSDQGQMLAAIAAVVGLAF